MSDNFGTGQSRVLSVSDRSLDQVVFQDRRVPLTSEWNLINQIADYKATEALKVNQPSGWLQVGDIKDSGATTTSENIDEFEYAAKSGDVLTSLTYNSLTLKLACRETQNVAVVNGWPIIIQNPASYSLVPSLAHLALENDTGTFIDMVLPAGTGNYGYDIVFLEVWRKLVGGSENIYPYGNVDTTPFSDNEIIYDTIGSETTKRVQLQYRIRTTPSASYGNLLNPSEYPSGLGLSDVRPVGGNNSGQYVDRSGYHFKSAGPRDPGLFIAGDGSERAKTWLNTVDGYVYAIPMFLVYRRATGISYSPSNVHGSGVTRSDFISGTVSDRPDGKLSDVIVFDDIIDVRHQLVTSGESLDKIVQESFRKLVRGDLKTTVGTGFTTNGNSLVCSGGTECVKVEQLNGTGTPLPSIGSGISSGLSRRVYAKAGESQKHYVVEVPMNGDTWWEPGTISLSSFISSTYGSVSSVDGFYIGTKEEWSTVTGVSSTLTEVTIGSDSNIIDETYKLYMEYTFDYDADSSGFYDVPKEFLEAGKHIYQPIAVRDRDLPVRYDNSHQLLTSASEDYLSYRGGNYTESFDFGHDYVHHKTVNSSSTSVSCVGGTFNGYQILGVKRVQIYSGGSWSLAETFNVDRNIIGSDISFDINITSEIILSSTNIRITLVTGSGSTESTAMKFFELSKQGRGVVDVYETIEVIATPDDASDEANGIYTIDTGDKPIISIHSYAVEDTGDFVVGQPFAFEKDGSSSESMVEIYPTGYGTPSGDINNFLPVLSSSDYGSTILPTRIKVQRTAPPPHPDELRVAVLVHSYVTASESPYNFYYKFVPYQGIVTAGLKGKIEQEGPAVVTTEGSGEITNHTFDSGTVEVSQGTRLVTQITGDSWEYHIEVGDYFVPVGSSYMYRIQYVGTDATGTDKETKITLAEPFLETSLAGSSYSIIRLDVSDSNISNVIDRMPSYSQEDYVGISAEIRLGDLRGTVLDVASKSRLQDPMESVTNDFVIGSEKQTGSRGRNKFVLTDTENSLIQLGEKTPYIKYGTLTSWTSKGSKKVFQAYLFNKSYVDELEKTRDLTGRLYLLVVSSETELDSTDILLNPYSVKDSVDVFELVGRPVVKTS